jgi:hypothetical protein
MLKRLENLFAAWAADPINFYAVPLLTTLADDAHTLQRAVVDQKAALAETKTQLYEVANRLSSEQDNKPTQVGRISIEYLLEVANALPQPPSVVKKLKEAKNKTWSQAKNMWDPVIDAVTPTERKLNTTAFAIKHFVQTLRALQAEGLSTVDSEEVRELLKLAV